MGNPEQDSACTGGGSPEGDRIIAAGGAGRFSVGRKRVRWGCVLLRRGKLVESVSPGGGDHSVGGAQSSQWRDQFLVDRPGRALKSRAPGDASGRRQSSNAAVPRSVSC